MSDAEHKLLCMLAKADGADPEKLTKADVRKYYADVLLSQKIAEHEAERLFQGWLKKK